MDAVPSPRHAGTLAGLCAVALACAAALLLVTPGSGHATSVRAATTAIAFIVAGIVIIRSAATSTWPGVRAVAIAFLLVRRCGGDLRHRRDGIRHRRASASRRRRDARARGALRVGGTRRVRRASRTARPSGGHRRRAAAHAVARRDRLRGAPTAGGDDRGGRVRGDVRDPGRVDRGRLRRSRRLAPDARTPPRVPVSRAAGGGDHPLRRRLDRRDRPPGSLVERRHLRRRPAGARRHLSVVAPRRGASAVGRNDAHRAATADERHGHRRVRRAVDRGDPGRCPGHRRGPRHGAPVAARGGDRRADPDEPARERRGLHAHAGRARATGAPR